ncbi:MAG: hypothetical protein ABEK10_02865 [Candidatus Nanosalina sp.]
MEFLGIKNERKIIDGLVVLIAFSSSYFGGFLQTLELGAVSVAVLMPVGFILLLCFMHLVLRKSRKFDETEHNPLYIILKGISFAGMTLTAYRTGISTTNNFIPGNRLMTGLAAVFFILSLYLMAYRANRNQ